MCSAIVGARVIPARLVDNRKEHFLDEQVVVRRVNRAAELAAEIADGHQAARASGADQTLQATNSPGQMLKEAPCVNDVERITRELFGEQIHPPRFEVRLVERHDEPWVQVDS